MKVPYLALVGAVGHRKKVLSVVINCLLNGIPSIQLLLQLKFKLILLHMISITRKKGGTVNAVCAYITIVCLQFIFGTLSLWPLSLGTYLF